MKQPQTEAGFPRSSVTEHLQTSARLHPIPFTARARSVCYVSDVFKIHFPSGRWQQRYY